MVTSVGVIGVGAMGGPIARRLHEAGFAVTVCDQNESTLTRVAASGAVAVRQAAHCGACDVVLVLVATPQQVRQVVAGEDGLVTGVQSGHRPIVLIMSTVPGHVVIDLQSAVASSGVRLLDAPISGGLLRAEEGTLSVMAGGDKSDLQAVQPVLDVIATDVFHCGPLGSGATIKIVNNIVGTANTLVLAEACRIALECGLDLDETVRVLDASSGRTYLTGSPGEVPQFFARLTRTRQDFDSLTAIMRKDFSLAVDLAADVEGTYPLIDRLKSFADSIGDETYENWHAVGVPVPTMTKSTD